MEEKYAESVYEVDILRYGQKDWLKWNKMILRWNKNVSI